MNSITQIAGHIDTGAKYLLLNGHVMECLARLESNSVHVVVTSVPYFQLRDYGFAGQYGLESTPAEYVANQVAVFREVRRVLRSDGVLWLNVGDSYSKDSKYGGTSGSLHGPQADAGAIPRGYRLAGVPNGNKIGIPWMLAFGLRDDGWILRQDNIWAKPAPMPEPIQGVKWMRCRVKVGASARAKYKKAEINGQKPHGDRDGAAFASSAEWIDCAGCDRCEPNGGYVLRQGSGRCTTSHEYIFQFTKSQKYFYDADSSKEPCSGGAHSRGTGLNPKAMATDADQPRDLLSKANTSFSSACNQVVETRLLRSVWKIPPEGTKHKHFAAYPTELVRRALSTSISKGGCCSECGCQYAPVVTSDRIATRPGNNTKVVRVSTHEESPYGNHHGSIVGNRDPQRHTTVTSVIGYRATCSCNAEVGRPVVLDPYVGTGTTLQVALRMGADGVGCDGSEEYLRFAVERIQTPWTPAGSRKPKKAKRRKHKLQKELF